MGEIYEPAITNFFNQTHRFQDIDLDAKRRKVEQSVYQMIVGKISKDNTISYLMKSGYSKPDARRLVEKVETGVRKFRQKKGQRKMVFGAIFVMLGLIISLLPLSIIPLKTAFLLSGIMVLIGGIRFLRGFLYYVK